jgi:hypothetical protein
LVEKNEEIDMPNYVVVYHPKSNVWETVRDRGNARALMAHKVVNKEAFCFPAKNKEEALARAMRTRRFYEQQELGDRLVIGDQPEQEVREL